MRQRGARQVGQLYDWLDYEHVGFITLERVCPRAWQAYQRGDHENGIDVPAAERSGQRGDQGVFRSF